MFNLWGLTGAAYGRDFLDCKSPGIHLWYLLLARAFGWVYGQAQKVRWIRFGHHLLMGMAAVGYALLSGDGWGGLAFAVLVNSGFVLAFHGNVGQLPAALILLAMGLGGSGWGALLIALAVFVEPKLAVTGIVLFVLNGWYVEGAAIGLVGLIVASWLAIYRKDIWRWLVEANLTIPARMTKKRRVDWFAWYWKDGLIALLPWLGLAIVSRPDVLYWLPALGYALVLIPGKALRPNHLIPLIPWIAGAGMEPWMAALMWAADWTAGGLYLGDVWMRFYNGIAADNVEARAVGKWLHALPGERLWVNGYLTQIYIYAHKRPAGGMCEQLEIREVAKERRADFLARFRANAPDWVVVTSSPGAQFETKGYGQAARTERSLIYKKER